jgi:opacity protein-like surface antigen
MKVNAQETGVMRDLEMRNSITIQKKINDHWKISLQEEFRFTENITRFDIFLIDLGVHYKINQHFSAGANYRLYKNKNSDNEFINQHRLSANINYTKKINRFTFGYRIQFQNKNEELLPGETANKLYNLRNKISIEYNTKNFKLDPYFQTELYQQFESGEDSFFNKVQWTLGISYSVTKRSDLILYYRFYKDLNQDYPGNSNVLGLGYKFSF